MAEPQPPNVTEGASSADAEAAAPPSAGPGGAEGRKAAAALSSLDSRGGAADDESTTKSAKSTADQKALGEAMSRLEIMEKGKKLGGEGKAGGEEDDKGKKERAAEAEKAKKIKLDPQDVSLLVEELEVSKKRAEEKLRGKGGDAVAAIRDWVQPVA